MGEALSGSGAQGCAPTELADPERIRAGSGMDMGIPLLTPAVVVGTVIS